MANHTVGRSLDEAMAGVRPPEKFINPFGMQVIHPRTGRLSAPARKPVRDPEKTLGRKRRNPRTDPNSPEFDPEYVKLKFLRSSARAKRTRSGAKMKTSVPKGFTAEQWDSIFAERLKKAAQIVDDMIDSDQVSFVNGFDDREPAKNRDLTTDAGKAAAALDLATAVMISPEVGLQDRHRFLSTVLQYTKSKPAEKREIKVNPEDFLMGLVDEV